MDDWAKRRGQSYGTDLERHRVLDLLPERSAETLAQWLKKYPSIEVVTRDCSGEYALGIQTGAPQTIQVADRWHLFKNLTDMTERAMQDLHSSLQTQPSPSSTITAARREAFPRAKSDLKRQHKNRQRRLRIYQQIQYLKQQGSQRRIACVLGHSRGLVCRYFTADEFPDAQPRQVPSIIDPYLDYLEQRYVAGCTQAPQLWHEICAQGYPGTQSQISKWLQNRRKRTDTAPGTSKTERLLNQSSIALPSLKTCVWLFTSDPTHLKPEEQLLLEQLQRIEILHTLYDLIQRFVLLIQEHCAGLFDAWLVDAANCDITACQRFAASL